MNRYYMLSLLLVGLALPGIAQVKTDTTATPRPLKQVQFESVIGPKEAQAVTAAQSDLQAKVEAAIERARAQRGEKYLKNPKQPAALDPQILTRAEELWQKDRDAHSGRAQHDLAYYYKQVEATSKTKKQAPSYEEQYDPQIRTQAEALLQKDRDAHNGYATHTLDYYYQQVLKESEK